MKKRNSSKTALVSQLKLTPWDRKLMAWHEAGHAVVSYYSLEQERVCRISINPSDEAFRMMKLVKRKQHNMTRKSLVGNIAVALAGRLSEEIFLHEVSSSCIHDLNKARDIAVQMVSSLGMGTRIGLLSCWNPVDNSFLLLSEQQREKLFLDVTDIINEARNDATKILIEYKRQVCKTAAVLLEKETLGWRELKKLLW